MCTHTHTHTFLSFGLLMNIWAVFTLGHLLTSLHVDIGFVSPRHIVKFTFIECDPGRWTEGDL